MFTTEGLILQLAYGLLIAAVLARASRGARLFVALAAMALLVRSIVLHDYVSTGWMVALLIAWGIMLRSDGTSGDTAQFSDEEEHLRGNFLPALSPGQARLLIDQGLWLSGAPGDVLTREGEPVPHLYYLASGDAEVTSHGHQVGMCRACALVGEATILSGEPATATVTLVTAARFWCIAPATLLPFLADHEALRQAIERSFSTALKDKLRAVNLAIAGE